MAYGHRFHTRHSWLPVTVCPVCRGSGHRDLVMEADGVVEVVKDRAPCRTCWGNRTVPDCG